MKLLFLIVIYGYIIAPVLIGVGGAAIYANYNWTGGLAIFAGVVLLLVRWMFSGVSVQ